ncbi:MFS transporter [Ancylobacter oerskovii]|uniref:MFS transporter n=2 Tax=Ancylobacter oerskovii TaxID=459519 RepID=A0ABW4Z524_9HYPH|nr:MFS transporter [Ancylobacter oerskovii]
MAEDFRMAVPTVALLVVLFTLVLALSSPLTTVASGRLPRRQVLLAAMSFFAIGNLTAALSSSFAVLMGARVLMAIGAGLYVPVANGLAGVIVPAQCSSPACCIR